MQARTSSGKIYQVSATDKFRLVTSKGALIGRSGNLLASLFLVESGLWSPTGKPVVFCVGG